MFGVDRDPGIMVDLVVYSIGLRLNFGAAFSTPGIGGENMPYQGSRCLRMPVNSRKDQRKIIFRMDIGAGRGTFAIPADTMHSFASRHNKIIWSIVLHGEISGWPDVKTEFPINVAPLAIKRVLA